MENNLIGIPVEFMILDCDAKSMKVINQCIAEVKLRTEIINLYVLILFSRSVKGKIFSVSYLSVLY